MSVAYSLDVGSLTTTTCGNVGCGIAFAIPTSMHDVRRLDGKDFYCPNGHRIAFGNTENERLKRELIQAQKRYEWENRGKLRALEEAARLEKRRRATKGALTRVRQRVAAGCCPQCSAKFPDLAAHMQEKHPTSPAQRPQKP